MKKLILLLLAFIFIGYEYIIYALTGTLVVPQQYEPAYETITLSLLIATIITQAAIFLVKKERFWQAAALQVMSFIMAVVADMAARDYYHNQVTAYPDWSSIIVYGAVEVAVLTAMIYLWKK